MFKRAFEDGIKVRVSRYSEIKSVRGATGVIRSGFEYDGRVDVEFDEEFSLGNFTCAKCRLVLVDELEVVV